jgi:predicted nucleic acid-binding protein
VRDLLDGVAYVELAPPVLARALEPFPVPVRTLDALHLATMDFLRAHGQALELASYDERLLAGARALQIPTRRV